MGKLEKQLQRWKFWDSDLILRESLSFSEKSILVAWLILGQSITSTGNGSIRLLPNVCLSNWNYVVAVDANMWLNLMLLWSWVFLWIYRFKLFSLTTGSPFSSIDSILPHSEEERIFAEFSFVEGFLFTAGFCLSFVGDVETSRKRRVKVKVKVSECDPDMLGGRQENFYWIFMI